jgi:uncharacterized protein
LTNFPDNSASSRDSFNGGSEDAVVSGSDQETAEALYLCDPVWNVWDVLATTFLVVVAAFASMLSLSKFAPGSLVRGTGDQVEIAGIAVIGIQAVIYLVVFSCMYLSVAARKGVGQFWRSMRWHWPGNSWLFAILGVLTQIVLLLLEFFLPMPKKTPFDALLRERSTLIPIAVIAVSFAPLMEELFFRGFLYPVLERGFEKFLRYLEYPIPPTRRLSVVIALVLSAFGFGLLHFAEYGHSWASVLVIFLVGVVLGMVRAYKDSVAAGFLVHAGYNGTAVLAMIVVTGGFRHLEKLSR